MGFQKDLFMNTLLFILDYFTSIHIHSNKI